MKELSVIIPFCNECPQVVFTAQALVEELEGFCEYEIILIDNRSDDRVEITTGERSTPEIDKNFFPEGQANRETYCKPRTFPAYSRNYFHNPPKPQIRTYLFRAGKLRYEQYDDKLGHWNAKNHGIKVSTGKYLFFLDAHCIMKRDSVRKMLEFLRSMDGQKVGGVHAYINYMLDSNSLEYTLGRMNPETGKIDPKFFGYQFCSCQKDIEIVKGRRKPHRKKVPYKVGVMSTCGMMCPRTVIDELGGWNPEFGIYGGGESYMNWKQSTCGYPHWIHPEAWCWHYADKRGYSWNYTDKMRNGMIAAYCVGGDKWLDDQIEKFSKKGNRSIVEQVGENVRTTCKADRDFIASKQEMTFDEYIEYWEAHPGVWK